MNRPYHNETPGFDAPKMCRDPVASARAYIVAFFSPATISSTHCAGVD